ncbi:calcium transporting ATPase [Ceratobasidium sp. AG-Ba]|nr:calcium transporting ATPase [Ceratobasidium sp. AG-Ba]
MLLSPLVRNGSMGASWLSTPLQLKLNALTELIGKLGSTAGLILFTTPIIEFSSSSRPSLNGLPLVVTLTLTFATKRMTKQRLLVRVLGSCEAMNNASVVCTDKPSTPTQNVMSVVAESVGIRCKFVQHLSENEGRQNVNHVVDD